MKLNTHSNFKETDLGLIPEDWDIIQLGEYSDILTGFPFKSALFSESGIKLVRGDNVTTGSLRWGNKTKYWEEIDHKLSKYCLKSGDVLVSMDGSLVGKNFAQVKDSDLPLLLVQRVARIRSNEKMDQNFIYFLIGSSKFKEYIDLVKTGTSIPHISAKQIKEFEFALPPLKSQKAISKTLSSLENKIIINKKINQTLEEIGQTIFKHWFVHFEFPNDEGKPYKSSGGEMVDSELGEIPKGWKIGTLGQIVDNFDSKRIPLSGRERESRKGKYPYYGATSIMDYIDDYIFDGIHILMAEDGSVMDNNERPVLQYVWGKFWVNNHTHVLKGKNGFSDEHIYLLLKNTNVNHLVTGAVQLKINQKNMNSLKIIIPDLNTLKIFSDIITPFFSKYRILSEETITLSKIRDSLLPKLMSGKIRVDESENGA